MRIISGAARGRHLKAVKGMNTRPTSDRVKEALFNILRDRVLEAKVLDLFAGTGNLGLEALSRGACSALFVEKDSNAIGVIRENILAVGLEGAEVIKGDVFKCIPLLKQKGPFDLIFADPPYRRGLGAEIVAVIGENNLLADEGVMVLEQSKSEEKNSEIGGLMLIRSENYGDTSLSFFQNKASQQ